MDGDTLGVLRVLWSVNGGVFSGLTHYNSDNGDTWIDAAVAIPGQLNVKVSNRNGLLSTHMD